MPFWDVQRGRDGARDEPTSQVQTGRRSSRELNFHTNMSRIAGLSKKPALKKHPLKKALIGWFSHQGNCFLFPVMFSRKFLPENCSEAPAPVGAPAPIQMTKPGAQPERMDGCGSLAPLSRVLVLEPKATGTSGKNDQLCFPTSCIT